MYKGIVLNELLLKIVTEVKSPKLNTNTVVLTNRNSYLILGKSILINLVKDFILKRSVFLYSELWFSINLLDKKINIIGVIKKLFISETIQILLKIKFNWKLK